ncbi:MAG: flavodoxin family protein [Prevotella sp.]
MMKTKKLLILNASPRKKGNIAQMVAEMSDEAKAQGAEVDVVEVQKLNVQPCVACMQCRARGFCVLPEDDSQRVLQLIKDSDAIVIAAPCYWGNIPGTLKLLFDRIVYGMMDESDRGFPIPLHKGKRCVLVSTSTTPWPLNILMHQSRGAIRALREICRYSGFNIVATIEKGGTRRNTTLSERESMKCRKAIRKMLIF